MSSACILSVAGPDLREAEARLFAEHHPWGVILMGRSCKTRDQVRALVEAIWQAVGHQCLVFIDQEGGRVARLKAPEWPVFPAGRVYAQLYEQNADLGCEAVWLGHRLIAHELAEMGIYADCAPVVDIPVEGAHDVIGDRAFGADPIQVATLARAALKGLGDGGVAGVIKHIPGHGRSMCDSHLELPRVMAEQSELDTDFDAFARVNDAPMAMTAHIAYEAFDPGVAATISPIMVQEIIRERIGFDGLLMTDDLGMQALGGDLSSRADAAIAAGCDMLLHCSGFLKDPDEILAEMRQVAIAAPELSGRALERAQCVETMTGRCEPFDVAAGWARLNELLGDVGATA